MKNISYKTRGFFPSTTQNCYEVYQVYKSWDLKRQINSFRSAPAAQADRITP